jgi:hypothetical protein
MNSLMIVFMPSAAVLAIFLFSFLMTRGKVCPNCATPLPSLQSPFTKSRRQWLEGGYRCQHCGCETDRAGVQVRPDTPPRRRSLAIGALLLVTASVPTVLLWMLYTAP